MAGPRGKSPLLRFAKNADAVAKQAKDPEARHIIEFEQDDTERNINFPVLSESLEEIDDQYKESEFYSPLKQSKVDVTSLSSSWAGGNSALGASPQKLQQTMNKLIQRKLFEEHQIGKSKNSTQELDGVFSELEGDEISQSQLSSILEQSPDAANRLMSSWRGGIQPNKLSSTLNMPRLNLEQTKLVFNNPPDFNDSKKIADFETFM